jgi:transposase InsO family protein
MRRLGLRSRAQKRRFVRTTDSSHHEPVAPNQLARCFEASAPNEKWVADITYIPTARGWVYLAAVMDLFSRRIIGWALSEHLDTTLVESALDNALESRCPSTGLVHHSDRGSQYASDRYRMLLRRHGIECSMSRRGDCWDNAPMESFFGALKSEWIRYERLENLEDAHRSVFHYIDVFYNRRRLHQSLDYRSPVEYEASHRSEAA